MIAALRTHLERLVFAAACVAVLASAWWFHRSSAAIDALRLEATTVALAGGGYVRVEWPTAADAGMAWPKPRAQSHGADWIYEVFTPPVIYYDAAARAFAVTPPTAHAESTLAFGLELLDLRRELYRLQLVGFVGEPGDYVAAFTSTQTPETLLARSGGTFDGLGLALRSVEVRKVNVSDDSALPAWEFAAFAVLRDMRSGADVVLDSRARKFTDTPVAVLRLAPTTKPREVREGDVIEEETATYRIDRIQLEPPEVVVAKQVAGLPFPETKVLRPVAAERAALRPPEKKLIARDQTGVAEAAARP